MKQPDKVGILLINTGSPDAPETGPVRRYLRQFLSDPRVIDLNPILRWLLLNLVILPTRPKESAHAYSQIWTDRGSPLIVNSEDFRDRLREHFPEAAIEIGMAYGNPSVPDAIARLVEQGASRLLLAPMFPQYASATVGSVLELSYKTVAKMPNVMPVSVAPPFYAEPEFLDAWAAMASEYLESFKPDHVLLSFHGLPERHVKNCDPSGAHCLQREDCCATHHEVAPMCYGGHCYVTARGIADRLGLASSDYTLAYQSKLGRDPWLAPATDETIEQLADKGVKRLAVLSPAFVADCIETIEELGIQGKEAFEERGGEAFLLVPSLNAHTKWVEGFAEILRRAGAESRQASEPLSLAHS